jgi:hypothetical protein
MKRVEPTWQLVLSASQALAESIGEFRLQELIAEVQRLAPDRERGSISPVVQGMTLNAGLGPQSPCGKPLYRVSHGLYRLADSPSDAQLPLYSPSRRDQPRVVRTRAARDHEIARRCASVAARFENYLDAHDDENPIAMSARYEPHRETIDLRRRFGDVDAAIASDDLLAGIHQTLVAWGIGRRASRLIGVDQFAERVRSVSDSISALDGLSIEDPDLDVERIGPQVWSIVDALKIVSSTSVIVPGVKTLHHLLPDLIPPMSRAGTGSFFLWSASEAHTGQRQLLQRTFARYAELAPAVTPSAYVGAGWRTSATKVLDNAIIGYCALNDLRPLAMR